MAAAAHQRALLTLAFLAACSREREVTVVKRDPVDAYVAPAVPSAKPEPRAEYCESNADCAYDDPCNATACVAATARPVGCDESAPPPGKCICADSRCTLMRKNPASGAIATGCASDADCEFVASTGSCVAGKPLLFIATSGGLCHCGAGTCTPEFIEPIACKTSLDCSWLESPRRPAPASKVPRPKPPIKPCSGGSFDSVCAAGRCELRVWKC